MNDKIEVVYFTDCPNAAIVIQTLQCYHFHTVPSRRHPYLTYSETWEMFRIELENNESKPSVWIAIRDFMPTQILP